MNDYKELQTESMKQEHVRRSNGSESRLFNKNIPGIGLIPKPKQKARPKPLPIEIQNMKSGVKVPRIINLIHKQQSQGMDNRLAQAQ